MYCLDAARTELSNLHHLPKDGQIHIGLEEEYFVPLGFTVYRTNYDNGTDAIWEKLIADIESKTKENIRFTYQDNMHIPEEAEAVEKMISLVKMDPRSDKSLLEGRGDDQLRAIFNDGTGGVPLNTRAGHRHRLFFVADGTVFRRQRGKHPWVRVVEVDYNPEQHKSLPADPQIYWGWMKLAISSMFFFHIRLYGLELWEMVPEMVEMERAKIYDGGASEYDEDDSSISLQNKRTKEKEKAISNYMLPVETAYINSKVVRLLPQVFNCFKNFLGEITGSCPPILEHFVHHFMDNASSVVYKSPAVKGLYPCSPKSDYSDLIIWIGGVKRPLSKRKLRFDVVDDDGQILGDV